MAVRAELGEQRMVDAHGIAVDLAGVLDQQFGALDNIYLHARFEQLVGDIAFAKTHL